MKQIRDLCGYERGVGKAGGENSGGGYDREIWGRAGKKTRGKKKPAGRISMRE